MPFPFRWTTLLRLYSDPTIDKSLLTYLTLLLGSAGLTALSSSTLLAAIPEAERANFSYLVILSIAAINLIWLVSRLLVRLCPEEIHFWPNNDAYVNAKLDNLDKVGKGPDRNDYGAANENEYDRKDKSNCIVRLITTLLFWLTAAILLLSAWKTVSFLVKFLFY